MPALIYWTQCFENTKYQSDVAFSIHTLTGKQTRIHAHAHTHSPTQAQAHVRQKKLKIRITEMKISNVRHEHKSETNLVIE